ncbi:MAG: DEAD/DEAH box helicase [Clostridiaceae bacterium]|nr:DEAD/DEAH box helicase [Clostridiaceae bacterium]
MIVDSDILKELCNSTGDQLKEKAEKHIEQKKINITKVIYENLKKFEIRSKVNDKGNIHNVYIKIEQGEIENLTCDCEEYNNNYGTCEHILATILEFNRNENYIRIFIGNEEKKQNDMSLYKKYQKQDERYRNFKQLIHTFYPVHEQEKIENKQKNISNTIKIEPKLIYNSYLKTLKLEIKIGDKQLYKLKSFPEFYEHMQKKEYYRYGTKLEFLHSEDAFVKEDIPLLHYILKYAEIIKYANESTNQYTHYGTTIEDSYITISNSGLDELFNALEGKIINFQKESKEEKVLLLKQIPNIKFIIEEEGKNECNLSPNIDIYGYDVLEGKKYIYLYMNSTLYQCDNNFKNTTLKLLQVYRDNFTNEITFPKNELSQLFSIVFPKLREQIEVKNLKEEEIEKYIPKELYVKVYLDYNENNYITADIKFIYGEQEFNPLLEQDLNIPRDIAKEDEVLEIFRKSGFMLEVEKARLILVKEEHIYQFLSIDIENYMKKFEVLATNNFKQKEIRQPKIGTLGVRIENNLLNIDFSNLDFDSSEIKEIMQKYHLKKKYHRLKDGSFLNLEGNETISLIDNITSGMDVNYKELETGEIKLPIYRSLYLDKILENVKATNIIKDGLYKELINKVENKDFNMYSVLPKNLNANLRNYQKTGYEWLKVLDNYKFGGILADDMGLGKTIQLLAVILDYIQREKRPKTSIVVCPSSLSLNWQNEIKKFTPDLNSVVIRGNAEERKKQIESIPKYNIAITSYELLKRDIEIYRQLDYEFKYIIVDEAQYIKNNNTQNAKVIKEIKAETRYALTGTPIENSLSELWSIFDFIMPGYLFGYHKFKELYEMPIVREDDRLAMRKLKMLIEPFILRRIKTEVLTELPDKTITVLNSQMEEEQQKIYLSYLQSAKNEAFSEINNNGFEKSKIKILSLLMRLRQICCHPNLFLNDYKGESSKLNQCIEVIKDAVYSGHKILLFSTYTGMFPIIEKELKKEKIEFCKLTGQTKVGDRIKLVDEFNENENLKVFLISLKAGGTGLNLIGADMVIHYDPWWNLSAENQATDRTYRIGQKKNVQVYKLITKNSIEEKIYELQERKSKLIDNMLSTNETFLNKLSKDEIMELFR